MSFKNVIDSKTYKDGYILKFQAKPGRCRLLIGNILYKRCLLSVSVWGLQYLKSYDGLQKRFLQ